MRYNLYTCFNIEYKNISFSHNLFFIIILIINKKKIFILCYENKENLEIELVYKKTISIFVTKICNIVKYFFCCY